MSPDQPALVIALSGERASTLTAEAIAALVGGELQGAAGTIVNAVAPLDRALANHLSFFSDARYASDFASTLAGVVLVAPALAESPCPAASRIVVKNPTESMLGVLEVLYPPGKKRRGVHATASIGRGATLGSDVSLDAYVVIGDGASVGDRVTIGANCYVGDGVTIGADSYLHAGAALYAGSHLGQRVIVHAGARIGSDGFGYLPTAAGHKKIPHVGRCVIHDDVEIGANTTIDRGSIDDTVVGAGTKIDNLVQVGHNVRIGRNCLIMAQVGIAGSTRLEDDCVVAGQAGIAGHVRIGRRAQIAAQAGVFGSVPAGEIWSGYPARPHRESLRALGALFKLAGRLKSIDRLLDEDKKK